jgi:hypothetical protein
VALRQLGVGAVQVVGHHQAEDGVAQELEPLVGLLAARLGAPGTMDEGPSQEEAVSPRQAQPRGQRGRLVAERLPSVLRAGHAGGSGPLELGDHVVHGVAHRPQVLQVLVVDSEASAALAQLLLECLHQLDEGQ